MSAPRWSRTPGNDTVGVGVPETVSFATDRHHRPGSGYAISADLRGLGIKIKWPGTGADGSVLRASWLAVDVTGQPGRAGQFWRTAAVSISTSRTWAGSASTLSRTVPAGDSPAQ